MPSTVANSGNSSSVKFISKRTRYRSSAATSDNLASGVTSRRSQRTLHGRKEVSKSIIAADLRPRLMNCKVLLSDIFSPDSQFLPLTKHRKETNINIQIHDVPEKDKTGKQYSSGKNNLTSTGPNSFVTRRTNSRRTKSVAEQVPLVENRSSTNNIDSEDPHSIIHLDESSIGMKSIAKIADLSLTQTFSSNDVIIQASKDAVSKSRRITRGKSLRSLDSNANNIVSRTASKRKSDNIISALEMGVSPPKQTPSSILAILENSAEASSSKSSATSQKDIQHETEKQNIHTGTSIIHLDQSSVGTKSNAEIADLSQILSGNDGIVQISKDAAIPRTRRVTWHKSMKATVSPPEEAPNTQPSVLQHTATPASAKDSITNGADMPTTVKQSINTGTSSTTRSLEKLKNNAFKVLIVSIKRVASALTEAELKRLKYEDTTPNNGVSLRPSSGIQWRPNSGIKVERHSLAKLARSTMAKPKIVMTSPIIEVPESPPVPDRSLLAHSYLAVPKTSTFQLDRLKKCLPSTHSPLPQLMEHEDEENDDVYEFLSSSQNNGISKSNKNTQKPKNKKGRKAAASSVKNKRIASAAKCKATSTKLANPFGCNNKALKNVIKKLGGGPVKQPTTVDYKINMEIPKSPPVAEHQQLDNSELPDIGLPASVEVSRPCHPTVERLKTGQPTFPFTSTPANRLISNQHLLSSQKPASPWRLQDELVVPRTSYTSRTKEMLPSYESFATKNNNISVRTSAFVTERRKSPIEESESFPPAPEDTPEQSCEGIVSDKDLREFERMYIELKATSEMSQKLIRAMRMSKKNRTTPQQNHAMRLACLKLKKWYDRSMNAFNRSMRIISNIQQTTEQSVNRPMACPSPLSIEQQRTVNSFNLSTNQFRSMIDQLQSAINDSDIENRPPPTSSVAQADSGLQCNGKGPMTMLNEVSKPSKDVVILPERDANAKRNPLMPLNVVPLIQRDSPLMSPLAKIPTTVPNKIRRELQYDKENESIKITDKQQQMDIDDVPAATPELPKTSAGSVVEIHDESTHNDCAPNDDTARTSNECSTEGIQNTRDYFGFVDGGDSVEERSAAQVTLPMPLNISHETLQRRLQHTKQLLPRRPIFRCQPKQQGRSSGPTRFPATKLHMFGSPSKRPHTLREFVASTPRPAGESSSSQAIVPAQFSETFDGEPRDVSAIEPITEPGPVEQNEDGAQKNNEPDVALFDTPDRPEWLNNSAHQRTYTRIPRRRKKNIYLANLGLDDDSADEENAPDGGPQELSSDLETDEAKRKKKADKRKARRKQPARVEQTKEFKQFVQNFNSMCEEVKRYELIVE